MQSKLDVSKTWVAGLASLPVYAVAAFLISAMPLTHWITMFIVIQFAVALLYRRVVIDRVAVGAQPISCLGQWFGLQGVAILIGLVLVTVLLPDGM